MPRARETAKGEPLANSLALKESASGITTLSVRLAKSCDSSFDMSDNVVRIIDYCSALQKYLREINKKMNALSNLHGTY